MGGGEVAMWLLGGTAMTYVRKTLRNTTTFEGLGLHSGIPVSIRVHPGNNGIVFRLGKQTWAANPSNVIDTSRCTRLGEISTIEHLMSAFAGFEITDAEVDLSAPELPALDGSAGNYYEGLVGTGLEQIGHGELVAPFSRIFVSDEEAKVALSAGEGRWRYEFDTGSRWPGLQVYETLDVVGDYSRISQARTFGFEEELPMIAAAGLAKGLDKSSALVLGKSGYLNPERFPDEPVLHKMLDLIGDIYLAGIPIRFLNVSARRSGHTLHVQAAKALWDMRNKK